MLVTGVSLMHRARHVGYRRPITLDGTEMLHLVYPDVKKIYDLWIVTLHGRECCVLFTLRFFSALGIFCFLFSRASTLTAFLRSCKG